MINRLNLDDLPIHALPRESRLVLTLYGRTQRPDDSQPAIENKEEGQENEESGDVQYEQVELGWASLQLFDYEG